jgi:glycosyltransferase involved in cell wall biosynthesis
MKILISAYSCEPGQGSERGVGWNVVREVSKYHEVWVLTRPDESKEAIEAELTRNPSPKLHFIYFTLPFWQNSMRWRQLGVMQLHYYLWQIQAYFVGKELHQKIGFDAIHHVTFVRYSCPSFLSFLPVAFIWGPVGGGESSPMTFWKDFIWKNKLYEMLRWVWRSLGESDPFARITAQRSAIVYATTKDTAKRVCRMGAPNVQISSETAISGQEIEQLAQFPPADDYPIRFIGIARLLHWKGFYLGLHAFAQARIPNSEYWIVGEGPELERLRKLVISLGIANRVKLWGLLSRDEVFQKLGQSSILVHPSLHDSGGWVCLEAMAAGRPVICLDLGGPAEQVTTETGFKVPAYNPEQTISDLAKAMICLANNKTLRLQMGRSGQQRVREYYNWEVKGKQLAQVYEEIVSI